MVRNGVITLHKRVDAAVETAPAVVYDVGCTTDQATRVRLCDAIPGSFDPDDVAFRSEYHGGGWSIEDGELCFEALLEPGERVRTLFCVERADSSALTAFLAEPTIEIAPGDTSGDENWGVLSADLVDVQIGDKADSSESGRTTTSDSTTAAADGGDLVAAADPSNQQFADQFIAKLDEADLSDTQRERLRSELGLESVSRIDARVEHCQKRLSDLSAYVDALETFLDEEGSGQDLIESFRGDVEAVEAQVSGLDADLDEQAEHHTRLRERVDDLEDTVESLVGVREDVSALESRFEETTTDLRTDIEDVREDVDDLQEWQEGVIAAFEGLQPLDDE